MTTYKLPPISALGRVWLDGLFERHSHIPKIEPIAQWAPKNIVLSEDESLQFPGAYDPSFSPSAMILFEFMENPIWREFVGVKSSQIGFTLAMLVAICHKIAFNPQHIIFCLNNREEIKRIGAQRLKPMILGCKAIAQRVPDDEDQLQNMTLYLIGMTIYLVGAQTAGAVANKSVGLVIGDEVDEWPEELQGGESNALDLLRDRIKRVEDAKLVVFSKPKNEDGIIWQEYLTGSRHKIFVPCPHCKVTQELVWEQMRFAHCRNPAGRWDYALLLTGTHYECLHCRQPIYERDKPWMLANRVVQATNTGQDEHPPIPRKFSYHTSDLYNLPHIPESSWGHLAKEWVSCTTSSQRRRFRRSRLGLPEGEITRGRKRKIQDILSLQAHYERGHCSRVPALILMGVDVQHDCKKAVKCAIYLDDTVEIVDHCVSLTFAELILWAKKPVTVDDWSPSAELELHKERYGDEKLDLMVDAGLIDEGDGHYTKTVLDFCTSPGAYQLFWPAKGREGAQILSMKDRVDVQKNHIHNGKPLPRYMFADGAFKEELYDERIALGPEIRKAKRAGEIPPAPELRIYRAPDTEFCVELTTERRWTEDDELVRRARKKAGTRSRRAMKVGDWFKDGGPNDFGDTVKEVLVLWYRLKKMFYGLGEVDQEEDVDSYPKPLELPS